MSKAERLADDLDAEFVTGRISNHTGRKAAAELRRLSAAEADFHMAYRIKCDEETKRLSAENEALRKALECLLVGAYAVGVPNAAERAVLHEAVEIAAAALAARQGGQG